MWYLNSVKYMKKYVILSTATGYYQLQALIERDR